MRILLYFYRILFLRYIGYAILSISLASCGIHTTPLATEIVDLPSSSMTPIVLGQPDFSSSTTPSAPAANNFGLYEYKIHSDGTRLFVSDYMNSRVLIWNSMPDSFQKPADVVLGQPSMTSDTCNYGGSRTAATICKPGGVFSDGHKLFVVDYGNNRILIWNNIPTSNFAAADIVLGQTNMTSGTANSGGVSASSLKSPWDLTIAGGKLFVSDYSNGRILIWNTIPTANFAAANVVVGQPNMTTNVTGAAPTASNMRSAYEVESDGNKLLVADTGNNRILIWNSIPTTNGVAADVVIGQANMTSGTALTTSSQSVTPTGVYLFAGKLYAIDAEGSRVLIWNSVPSTNHIAADEVFGQPDMLTNTANHGGVSSSSMGSWAEGLYVDNQRIIIGDPLNFRVLILPRF